MTWCASSLQDFLGRQRLEICLARRRARARQDQDRNCRERPNESSRSMRLVPTPYSSRGLKPAFTVGVMKRTSCRAHLPHLRVSTKFPSLYGAFSPASTPALTICYSTSCHSLGTVAKTSLLITLRPFMSHTARLPVWTFCQIRSAWPLPKSPTCACAKDATEQMSREKQTIKDIGSPNQGFALSARYAGHYGPLRIKRSKSQPQPSVRSRSTNSTLQSCPSSKPQTRTY